MPGAQTLALNLLFSPVRSSANSLSFFNGRPLFPLHDARWHLSLSLFAAATQTDADWVYVGGVTCESVDVGLSDSGCDRSRLGEGSAGGSQSPDRSGASLLERHLPRRWRDHLYVAGVKARHALCWGLDDAFELPPAALKVALSHLVDARGW